MKCPKGDGDLKPVNFKKVRIEECASCQGMWFDRDELRRAKDSTDEDLRWLDFDVFEDKENKYSKKPSERICPKDSIKLETLTYSDSKVAIERCSICLGIWLDHNDFKKIIVYLENKVVTESSGDYAKEMVEQFTQIINGPENLASELKDFLTVLKLAETRLGVEHANISYALVNFPIR